MSRTYLFSLLLLTPAILIAWTGPTQTPPNGNASEPVNVSATAQTKLGSLGAYGFFLSGSSKYINFSTTLGSSGYGIRDTSGALEFKGSGSSWGALTLASAGTVGVSASSAPLSKLTVGSAGSANSAYYDIGADKIAANTSLFSYGKICAGNSVGDCSGTGGVLINANGDVTAVAYYHSSDERLKSNIETSGGLALVEKLRGVTYTWRGSGAPSAGLIAQEVEQVMPSAVHTDAAGMKSVEYDQIVAPLVEAVKEQQKEIEELRYELHTLYAHTH